MAKPGSESISYGNASLTGGPEFLGHTQETGRENAVPGVGNDQSLVDALGWRAKTMPALVFEGPDRL